MLSLLVIQIFPQLTESAAVYDRIFEVFEMLPLAAVVAEQVLVLHGGIGDGSWGLNELKHEVCPQNFQTRRRSKVSFFLQ
eukprot:SAG31_NODE_28607_length_407_cov_1.808442_1_plen_79_part_01